MGRFFPLRAAVYCAVALLPLSALGGCVGSSTALQQCYSSARTQQYDRALADLEASSLAHSNRDRLLYLMEKGQLLHFKGDYRASNEVLREADHLTEKLFTTSLSAEGASLLTNDTVVPYAGTDYESVFINYYEALNYLALGEPDEARVECRKIDEKLDYFTDSYHGKNAFRRSAFLRFLTGLIYEAEGEWNDAFIDYRRSLEAYRDDFAKYGVPVPDSLWGRLLLCARRSGLGKESRELAAEAAKAGVTPDLSPAVIAVFVEDGQLPPKKEAFAVIPTGHGLTKVAFPVLAERGDLALPVTVRLDNGPWLPAEEAENVTAIARRSLDDARLRMIAKETVRVVAKQMVARRTEQEYGPLAGLAAQVVALLTERADLRGWSTLPNRILLTILPAAPGTHAVVIRSGTFEQRETVRLEPGGVGFVMGRVL